MLKPSKAPAITLSFGIHSWFQPVVEFGKACVSGECMRIEKFTLHEPVPDSFAAPSWKVCDIRFVKVAPNFIVMRVDERFPCSQQIILVFKVDYFGLLELTLGNITPRTLHKAYRFDVALRRAVTENGKSGSAL